MVFSKEEPSNKKKIGVKGLSMAFIEAGSGNPILFVHGNLTSSFVWRNVIPYLEKLGRCIAPDLIGMGDSDKLRNSGPHSYRFFEHRGYLGKFIDQLGVGKDVTLILHDWGTVLGLDWAYRNQNRIKGIAYMEGIVLPSTWSEFSSRADHSFKHGKEFFQALRTSAGEKMILEENLFIEKVLPNLILRKLTDEEMAVYRRPYLQPGEDRRPLLTWPREASLDGDPPDVTSIIKNIANWLPKSIIPKLFINGEPGAFLVGKKRDFCRTFARQDEVTVRGLHILQEDSPNEIGQAIREWLRKL